LSPSQIFKSTWPYIIESVFTEVNMYKVAKLTAPQVKELKIIHSYFSDLDEQFFSWASHNHTGER
jgi:hypothetical protein